MQHKLSLHAELLHAFHPRTSLHSLWFWAALAVPAVSFICCCFSTIFRIFPTPSLFFFFTLFMEDTFHTHWPSCMRLVKRCVLCQHLDETWPIFFFLLSLSTYSTSFWWERFLTVTYRSFPCVRAGPGVWVQPLSRVAVNWCTPLLISQAHFPGWYTYPPPPLTRPLSPYNDHANTGIWLFYDSCTLTHCCRIFFSSPTATLLKFCCLTYVCLSFRAPVLVALALIECGMKYEDAVQFIRL